MSKISRNSSNQHDGLVLVIDAGTTNLKVFVINQNLDIVDKFQRVLSKTSPQPGWSEQDPQEIISQSIELLGKSKAYLNNCVGLGITNQRESVASWDRANLRPNYPLIVWEDTRSDEFIDDIDVPENDIRNMTGLFLSSYYSAPKLMWLAKNTGLLSDRQTVAGTVDSWLLANLTGRYLTDYTNASRTLLYNINDMCWDGKLIDTFKLSKQILPNVQKSFGDFGRVSKKFFGKELPVLAVMGDQQASLYAAGNSPGTVKITYGTGIFPMRIIGTEFKLKPGMATTLAVGKNSQPLFAWEGYIKYAAKRVNEIFDDKAQLNELVEELAKETTPIARQLIDNSTSQVIVDGGISQNDHLLDIQRELLGIDLKRQKHHDGTALGVAKLILDNL